MRCSYFAALLLAFGLAGCANMQMANFLQTPLGGGNGTANVVDRQQALQDTMNPLLGRKRADVEAKLGAPVAQRAGGLAHYQYRMPYSHSRRSAVKGWGLAQQEMTPSAPDGYDVINAYFNTYGVLVRWEGQVR